MTDQQESKIPREQREIRNTHEARDDEPRYVLLTRQITMEEAQEMYGDADQDAPVIAENASFWPPRAVSELIEHALPDLRRARDRIQYVPHNQRIARDIASLEELMMLLRTERHY